jgi:thiol-disulfide isomerase/thioredoxin
MKIRKIVLISVVVLLLALSACAPVKSNDAMMNKPTEKMMEKPTEEMIEKSTDAMMENTEDGTMMDITTTPGKMTDETPTPDSMMAKPTEGAMMDAQSWLGTTFTDVITSKTFTISDFKNKVVLIELMAQWCSTCKKQQMEVKSLHEKLGMPADLITVALDIDPNENGADLKTYAAGNAFDWMYAIAPANVSREIGNLYGNLFLNPPSAPMLLVDRKGEVHPLPFGIKSADDLMKAIDLYLTGM